MDLDPDYGRPKIYLKKYKKIDISWFEKLDVLSGRL
jgi:hypothetical protein